METKSFSIRKRAPGYGANTLLALGVVITGLCMSVLAIDMGFYFTSQAQLQNITDAASLAGGQAMFEGQDKAEAAALELAEANETAGMDISASDLEFDMSAGSFRVTASKQVPTIMAKLLCGLSGKLEVIQQQEGQADNGSGSDGCTYMTVHAASKVVGAPRDTVLVIDTSSSMDDLGGGQPFLDVKDAANAFLDKIVVMAEDHPDSVDKIAIVKFDKTSSLVHTFTSVQDSPDLTALKNAVNNMTLYSGAGWCTNYEAGLKLALDQLAANARPGAKKTVIFFTDGEPNLPDYTPSINSCLFKKYFGQHSAAKTCAQNYVNNMISKTNTQIVRANDMEVTVHTIQISDPEGGTSLETMRWLLQDNTWEPGLVDAMANETEGKQFEAASADGGAIMEIFETVAKIVNIKLASTKQ